MFLISSRVPFCIFFFFFLLLSVPRLRARQLRAGPSLPLRRKKGRHAKEKAEQKRRCVCARGHAGCRSPWRCVFRRRGGQVVCSTDQSVLQRDEGPPPDFMSARWDRCGGEEPGSCCPEGSAKMLKWRFLFVFV